MTIPEPIAAASSTQSVKLPPMPSSKPLPPRWVPKPICEYSVHDEGEKEEVNTVHIELRRRAPPPPNDGQQLMLKPAAVEEQVITARKGVVPSLGRHQCYRQQHLFLDPPAVPRALGTIVSPTMPIETAGPIGVGPSSVHPPVQWSPLWSGKEFPPVRESPTFSSSRRLPYQVRGERYTRNNPYSPTMSVDTFVRPYDDPTVCLRELPYTSCSQRLKAYWKRLGSTSKRYMNGEGGGYQLKVGGVNSDLTEAELRHLVFQVTNDQVVHIRLLPRNLGLCCLRVGTEGEAQRITEAVGCGMWMGPIMALYASNEASRNYLGKFLEGLRQQRHQKRFPRHVVTVERWLSSGGHRRLEGQREQRTLDTEESLPEMIGEAEVLGATRRHCGETQSYSLAL